MTTPTLPDFSCSRDPDGSWRVDFDMPMGGYTENEAHELCSVLNSAGPLCPGCNAKAWGTRVEGGTRYCRLCDAYSQLTDARQVEREQKRELDHAWSRIAQLEQQCDDMANE